MNEKNPRNRDHFNQVFSNSIAHFAVEKKPFYFWSLVDFFALITQNLGSKYGIPYLFLAPEYLGEVNWLSYFILGFSIGGFFMAYHLYTYIILGPSFPFLVTLARPFYKFSINNSTFPILFYFLLIYNIYQVQCNEEFVSIGHFLVEILALTGGIVIFIIFSVLYFFKTNLDIIKLKGKEPSKKRSLYSTVNTLFTRKIIGSNPLQVQTYKPLITSHR